MSGKRSWLQELLAGELTRLMVTDGWSIDPAQEYGIDGSTIAAFRRPVRPDFAATAAFERPYSIPDVPPLIITAEVGVSYEPLYRLWPLLGDDVPIGELDAPGGTPQGGLEIENAEQVTDAARELFALTTERAIPFARRHASVEVLLQGNRGDADTFDWEIQLVPALLAAAGRHDEARAALAEYQASGRQETGDPEFRRFARLLTRWLDAGGVIPDAPTAPPVHEQLPARPRLRDSYQQGRARSQAVEAVLKAARNKTREQLQAMLGQELEARQVKMGPLAFERTIDAILVRQQPFGRLHGTAYTLGQFRTVGAGIVNLFRNHNRTEPDWLRPPDRAGYRIKTLHSADSTAAVNLDPDAMAWLAQTHAAALRRFGDTVHLDAWLDWDTAQPDRLAVHIGTHRVGTLDAESTDRCRVVMQRAATRDEVPQLHADLTAINREPRYLMQVDVPAPYPSNQ